MDGIPNEVIGIILAHMPYDDIKAARFVCKKWYHCSLMPKILKKEKLVYDGTDHTGRFTEMINAVSERACPYTIQFSATSLDSNLDNFWKTNGYKIHSIKLRKCSISRCCFYKMLELCVNLKDLVLDECSDYFFSLAPIDVNPCLPKLLRLKQFTITGYNLTDFDFNMLMSCFPNLNSLALEVADICFHHGLFRRYYPDNNNSDNLNSTNILTFDNVHHYITSHSQKIKSIHLSTTKVTSNELIRISDIPGLRLRRVYLNNCSEIDGHGVKYLIEKQDQLEVVELCRSFNVSNEILKAIAINLSQTLKKLNVGICSKFFSSELLSIMQMPHLEFLNIQPISILRCKKMNTRLPQHLNSNLKILTLYTKFPKYRWILESFSMLKSLDLSFTGDFVTNNFVQDIFIYLKNLEELLMRRCYKLTDEAFAVNGSTMQFDLSDRVKQLRVLDLGGCDGLTNVTLQQLLKLPSLRSLSLKDITRFTSRGFLSLPDNCPLIRCINVTNTRITNYGILKLASSFKRLEIIYADDCDDVTSDLLFSLLQFPFINVVSVCSEHYGRINGTFVKKTFKKYAV